MAKKSDAPPRYYHVEIVLGDRDDDLRTWCWNNPGLRGRAIREALRDWIEANPGTGTAPPAAVTPRQKLTGAPAERTHSFRDAPRQPAPARPRPPAAPAAPVAPIAPAPHAVTPAPAQPPEADAIPPTPDEATPLTIDAPTEPPAAPGKLNDEARARLRRMLSGNKEFI